MLCQQWGWNGIRKKKTQLGKSESSLQAISQHYSCFTPFDPFRNVSILAIAFGFVNGAAVDQYIEFSGRSPAIERGNGSSDHVLSVNPLRENMPSVALLQLVAGCKSAPVHQREWHSEAAATEEHNTSTPCVMVALNG
jgi:hypothetical protein